MKKRLLGSSIFVIVLVLSLLMNSQYFALFMSIIGILGLKELINARYKKKDIEVVRIIAYANVIFLVLNNILYELPSSIITAGILLSLLIPIVFYNSNEKYSINDALYMIGTTLFIGISISTIVYLKDIDINKCIYIFVIATMTDTFAYIGGKLVGKHKQTSISPNKTWEGSIIGSFFGTIIGSFYYLSFISDSNIIGIIFLTLGLTILSEIGDLVFSSIKRHYNIKDYGNVLPGHGGILDRLDSIIFVALGMALIITLL